MRRFFIDTPLGAEMIIAGQDAHHIKRVLRLKMGDQLVVVAPDGSAGTAKIKEITVDQVLLSLQETVLEDKEAPINVYLAQALPKSDKMDYIVQKAVELGIKGIYPMEAEHCVVQYDGAKRIARQQRWQKIAAEAAKQCGRSIIPVVKPIMNLVDILADLDVNTTVVMLYEGLVPLGLRQALAEHQTSDYLLLVGPEGGFSDKEVALCSRHGACVVTLGQRILRTETAALAGVAIIMYEHGDLGG